MDIEQLSQIGLNASQAKTYLHLLSIDQTTAPQLAEAINVTRTNAYELLDQLQQLGLISKNTSTTKTSYSANSPSSLKQLLLKEQQALKDRSNKLEGLLPSLLSTYRLTKEQPGVLYLEGLAGLTTLFDDIIRQQEELLIMPSGHDRDDPQVAAHIDQQIKRQVAAHIPVRTLYPTQEQLSPEILQLLHKNLVEVRYFSQDSYPAQVMIYGNNVAFTTYQTGAVTTIITNPDIALTMRLVFEGIWNTTQPVYPTKTDKPQ